MEDSVRRLTRYNDGLLAKAWNTIRDAIEMRRAIDTGDAEAVKAYKDLLRYEKVFRAALEARGVDLGTMAGRDEEEKTKFSLTKAKAERLEKAIDELGKKGISKKAGAKRLYY